MAARTGGVCVCLDHQLSHGRATKKNQGALIERLRNNKSQNHSWNETIRYVWSSVAERRAQIENTEPSGVQQCLDTMQKVITVKSQQTLKERLHLIGRRLGLNTQIQEEKVSLRTDTFQVDVLLGDSGVITNVRLANQGDVMECPDLKEILQQGDFAEFVEHLQGLQSMYQVTADEKLQSKACVALQALEKDLKQLAQFQSSISGVANYIHKCPLGIMLPRLAGKPMKLIYFVSPYDLLDKKSLAAHPLTVEAITENFLGQSVNVCIEPVPESAPANKLQTMPLMNVNKTQDGQSLPSFSAVSKINSMMLPASFVLVLAQSIPVSTQILHKITSQTGIDIHKEEESRNLRSLILETFSGGDIKEDRRLVVSLPNQQHIYFLDCLDGGCQEQQGMMVSRIPFTHPSHVPQILNLLRQQLLFNIVVGSCVRPGAKPESGKSIVFEVTAVSLQQLTIVFEHPAYDSLIRVDVDLSDITNLKCKVACTNSDQVLCSDEAISRVFHRCMSIPIMLRWLIGKGLGQLGRLKEAAVAADRQHREKEQFVRQLRQQQAKLQPSTVQANRPPPQPPHPPPLPAPASCPHDHSPVHVADGAVNSSGQVSASVDGRGVDELCHLIENSSQQVNHRLPICPDIEHVPQSVLIPLLHEEEPTSLSQHKEVHDAPMLSRLLDDNTSVATTVIPMDCKPCVMTCTRARKRKPLSDCTGPSPKYQLSDGDITERLAPLGASLHVDMLPGVIDHHLYNSSPAMRSMTPTYGSQGHHAHHPVLNRAPSRSQHNVIDLTEDSSVGESSLKRLSDLSMLFNETEAQNRIPNIPHNSPSGSKTEAQSRIANMLHNSPSGSKTEAQSRIANMLHNSPSGSKNENASTSLEGYLKGSGEVGRAKNFDPSDVSPGHSNSTLSKLSSLLLASSESPSPCLSVQPHPANSAMCTGTTGGDELCSSGVRTSPAHHAGGQDVKPSAVSLTPGALCQASSVDLINDGRSQTGSLFDKCDMSRQQKHVNTEAVSHEVQSQLVQGKVSLRLKVGPLKQQNSIKAFVKSYKSVDESSVCGKPNNLGTFDFKSDEDDDAPLVHVSSDRYVYSSSPTCLQISSKQKQFTDLAIHHKSDKVRKKDKSSGNTAKRKREKDKSKREKKKKRSEHCVEESVYRTVENDAKGDFKMKIRVKPMTDKSQICCDGKAPSYEITKKPLVSSTLKLLSSREHNKAAHVSQVNQEQDSVTANNSHKAVSSRSTLLLHKSASKMAASKMSPNAGSASKTDPKLATKATIRLKPLTMPNSSATVNMGQSASTASAAHKVQRRNTACVGPPVSDKRLAVHHSLERRGSASNLIDRRSIPQLSSSTSLLASATSTSTTSAPSTPTTSANLSLSSILPNAPTVSKIASLPRIPKLSSSSSNASIARTSSLDAVLESGPVSAGTKANNSYTVGPAGRSFPGTAVAPGTNRLSGSTAPFNYGSRAMTPSSGGSAAGWCTSNANRPGSTHRQTSPLINPDQAGLQRPAGSGAQSPSLGPKTGFGSAGGHRHAGTGSSSSSHRMLARTVGGGTAGSQLSQLMAHKPGPASAHTGAAQKHPSPNTHVSACSRTSAGSGNLSRSPNTSGMTKSPNSGRSPNITNPGRSPNITNPGRSPSVSSDGKLPNVYAASRCPNISNNTERSTGSCSTARPAVLHRHGPGVPKSVMKTHHSSTTHRTSTRVSGSIKSSSTHTGNHSSAGISGGLKSSSTHTGNHSSAGISGGLKSSSTHTGNQSNKVFSNSPHTGDSTPVAAGASPMSNVPCENSVSCWPSTELPSPCVERLTHTTPVFSSLPSVPTSSPVATSSSVTTSLSLLSVVQANTVDAADSSRDRNSAAAAVDTNHVLQSDKSFCSPIPVSAQGAAVTAHGADGIKNRLHSCSSRGRKSSLSAIVDKLKHSAVGSSLASPGLVPPCSESLASKVSGSFMGVEGGTSSVSSFSTQAERTLSSQLPMAAQSGAERVGEAVSTEQNEVMSGDQPALIAPHTDSVRNSDTLSSEIVCDHGKNIEDEPRHVPRVAEAVLADDSAKAESSHIDGIRLLDKLVQLGASQEETCASSHEESLVAGGHTPVASPFHPLQSPTVAIRNSSPLAVPRHGQPGQRPASSKPPAECLDEGQVLVSSLHLHSSSRSGDSREHHVTESLDHTGSAHVENDSKPLSSPLSDVSSPGSDLVIDDECGTRKVSTNSCKFSLGNSIHNSQSSNRVGSYRQSCGGSSGSQCLVEKAVRASTLDHATLTSCPGSTSPPSLSGRTTPLAKYPSCASSSKESDSPCPIDDDLMDMALGFDS